MSPRPPARSIVVGEPMNPQSDRRSLSRDLLSDVNARVASLASRDDEILSFLCECADDFCVDQVPMQVFRYREIRDDGAYVLAPGHQAERIRPVD
jgi:hypothetical protein